ncbi:putative acyl-CoA transferase/carnitine dehydratase [Paraburkholderia piptadeniae]|uniref:Acyl-CoA transferase/carnitine dehydratase n=1 Tax=Paraburkholderia piptadeniae TaxID=1701573 RepID=A0A1N7RVP8_9BURK|nr:CoA transferase [Paraburkholderia piptadeniae]SIT39172.1 putative acyl-CoA transferase/carnitine dehydratase [Paraburkholderia piptadeniae]
MSVLDNIRVLDFGRYVAGPYCATLLAEFGAEVIRIEKIGGSEDRFLLPALETGEGALFLQMSRNKKSMTLDPMKDEGRELVRRLVATADVVVANLPPTTLEAMGLDFASISAINPRTILTLATGFGQSGPMAGHLAFDSIGQAMSGGVYLSGHEGQPSRTQILWCDFGTALHCAYGTAMALIARETTGRGQVVDGSLFATAAMLGSAFATEATLTGRDRVGVGNRSFAAAPADIFATKDGWIICQVVGKPLFRRWAALMEEPGWLDDERFSTDDSRALHGGIISDRMQLWCESRTSADALSELATARIPAGPVLRPGELVRHPQAEATGLFDWVDYGTPSRPVPLARAPVFLSETPGGIREKPAMLGEHTDAILRSLGYAQAQINVLRSQRVI